MNKFRNMSFRAKLLLIVIPLIAITLIILSLTFSFIGNFSSQINTLGTKELENQKLQVLLLEVKNVTSETNSLLYQAKDTLLKLSQKEEQAAENYNTQLDILSGKISNVSGQLLSVKKETESKKLVESFQSLSAQLKNWGDEINQKKLGFAEANDEFKKNRKLIKAFIKDNMTFDDNIVSTTPELLQFVQKEESGFKIEALVFIVIIICIAIFSFYIIAGLVKFEADSAKAMDEAVRSFNMVEKSSISTMMGSVDGKIVYLNEAAKATFSKLENSLPGKVENLIGNSFDFLHKNPGEQSLPLKAVVSLGTDKIELTISAIYNAAGSYIGPMFTFEIVTAKILLVNNLTSAAENLAQAANNVLSISTNLSAAAEETSAQANTASVASEEVNAGVQTVASNMEEMVDAIKEITKTTNEASSMTNEAMQITLNTNEIINKLGDSSMDIGNVIKVISSIAQQTNLLALNATIEAARAGEAGKGFAVVANEVKELANQTAKATNEITKKIETIQSDSKNAVEAIGKISSAIEKVNGFTGNIAASVEEQAATTNEVKRIVTESAQGVKQINENISQVSQAAANTGKDANSAQVAAKGVGDIAESLKQYVDMLKA
jgi:methyl-accepting chemotaxis protein